MDQTQYLLMSGADDAKAAFEKGYISGEKDLRSFIEFMREHCKGAPED